MSSARNVKKVESSRRVGKARSGYNKGTIRVDPRYLVVSKDVRRHRLISISYITTLSCHGRGREFESRRPRHIFQDIYSLATAQFWCNEDATACASAYSRPCPFPSSLQSCAVLCDVILSTAPPN